MAKCKHETQNGICEIHSSYSYCHLCDLENLCKGYEPKTNADRIRAMSDEELAKWLCSISTAESCDSSCPVRYMCDFNDNALVEWLKQPADQDENGNLPKVGKWIFWNGWVSNHDLRIDDAFYSECGYQHPTVRWEEGDPTGKEARAAVLGKLAKECPLCGARMIGGGYGEGG